MFLTREICAYLFAGVKDKKKDHSILVRKGKASRPQFQTMSKPFFMNKSVKPIQVSSSWRPVLINETVKPYVRVVGK